MNRSLLASFALSFTTLAAGVGCAASSDDVTSSESALDARERAGDDAATSTDGDAGASDALETRVQALFASRCAPCHTDRAAGGLRLLDFTASTVDVPSTQLPSMRRIAPGDREQSYLLHKVKGTHTTVGGDGRQMPPDGPLAAEEVELIGAFIDAL